MFIFCFLCESENMHTEGNNNGLLQCWVYVHHYTFFIRQTYVQPDETTKVITNI